MGSELLWYRIEDQAIAKLEAVELRLEQAIAERAAKANRNGVSRDYAGPAVDLLAAQRRELEQIIKDAETNAFRSVQGENIPDPTDALRALVSAPVPSLAEILASTGTPESVPEPAPPATAGQTVSDDAATGPTANPPQTVAPGTDGRVTPPVETGTDAAPKTTEQTQAITTESNSGKPVAAPPTGTGAVTTPGAAVVNPGVAAAKDDAATPAPQAAVNANDAAGPNVKPRPNVLDDYASYSYSASVYLMTEPQYTRLLTSTTKTIDGYQLLFQSGGAANNVGGIRPPPTGGLSSGGGQGIDGQDGSGPGTPQPDGGRNPFFDNDFYIDSVIIENVPPGKGTGSAHTISSMKFTLIEPNGITLLDRLYDAVANSAPVGPDGKVNYSVATFLMVIRFYGYDSEGKLEQVRSKPDQEGTSDPSAVIEKFIPFKMKGINWGVGSKLVSYEWDCVPVGQLIAGYASRGTIPYDVQLVDSTVGGLLGSAIKYSSAGAPAAAPGQSTTANTNQSDAETRRLASAGTPPAPAKANAAPTDKTTITAGLAGAMNEFQKKLVKDGIFTYADEYVIEFIGPDANKIRDAKLQLPNAKVDKSKTAAGAPATKDSQVLDQGKTSVDMISRSFSITAGQQLLQAIELTIRNSSYIRDQALVIVNPDGTQIPNPNARDKPLKWFVITMSAEAISELDPKRNDKAYRITYSIASREVKNVISKYFPVSRFTGVHKSYPYWFTGENIAVLDYQETLNTMYQLTVSGGPSEKNLASQNREKYTSSMADIVTYNYAPTSTESGAGADGRSNEPGANAAEVLYSPGDLRECKVKIVGDPAWIMQGSNFRMPNDEYFSGQSLSTGFDPDGSISFDTQDVLFEIRWQRPEDYDLATGLADPYSQTQKKYNNRTALQSRVYQCKKVVSEFRQGKFEQTLEGAIYMFPVPDKSNTANPGAAAQLNSAGKDPNVTNEVAARQNIDLSTTAGQAARQNAAATDPRRVGSVDSANRESAAVIGAQQNSTATQTPSVSTGTGAGTATGPNLANTGVSGSGTNQPTPAGASRPATDSSGTVVGTPTAVGSTPPKIADNTSPTSPTNPANQLQALDT
jgi:hypothetical protein